MNHLISKHAVDIFKLSPDKVRRVNFKDNSFVSVNGKFYELFYKSDLGFELVGEVFIKVEIPHYTLVSKKSQTHHLEK